MSNLRAISSTRRADPAEPKRYLSLAFHVSKAEFDFITRAAKLRGHSISAFVRDAAMGATLSADMFPAEIEDHD